MAENRDSTKSWKIQEGIPHGTVSKFHLAAARQFKEYDYKFVLGDVGHNLHHAAAISPDTMRWLWRDYA